MLRSTRSVTAIPAAVILLALGGCSLSAFGGEDEVLTGAAACALGHSWALDLEDYSAQLLAELQGDNSKYTAVTAAGDQTLEWALDGFATLSSDYTVSITKAVSEGVVETTEQARSGTSTGLLTLHGATAVPSDWEEEYTASTTVDGVAPEVEPTIYDPLIDDTVALEVTCEGTSMTTHAHQDNLIIKWKRVD
jgi:hypothetical protein